MKKIYIHPEIHVKALKVESYFAVSLNTPESTTPPAVQSDDKYGFSKRSGFDDPSDGGVDWDF